MDVPSLGTSTQSTLRLVTLELGTPGLDTPALQILDCPRGFLAKQTNFILPWSTKDEEFFEILLERTKNRLICCFLFFIQSCLCV